MELNQCVNVFNISQKAKGNLQQDRLMTMSLLPTESCFQFPVVFCCFHHHYYQPSKTVTKG